MLYLVTGFQGNGICLAGIFCHQGVHIVDNVATDWGSEDGLIMHVGYS